MNKILLLLLFIIPLSLFGQVESQFNGTLNVFSGSRIGSTNTFTISGIFSSTTSQYTSANSAVGDIVQVQSGNRFYWLHIYSIASNSGGVITGNVRDSSSTLTTFPLGKWSIFRPTPNLRLPLSPDGETNASRSATFNTLALRVDEIETSVASATNCEQTITKASHGFRKGTPVFWNGSTYIRPTADSLVPDFVVVDSLTANTFKVANCGTYTTSLTNGLYWFTSASPGYSLTADTTKVPLFQALNGKLILNPIVGFNLMSGGGSGDVTSSVLADTAAAIRADFPNGIISALPNDSVGITSMHPLRISNPNGFVQIKDGKFIANWKSDNVIISAYNNRPIIDDGAAVSVGCCEDSIMYGGVLVGMYSSLKKGGVGYFSTLVGYNSEADSTVKYTIVGTKNVTFGVRGDAAVIGNHNKFKASAIIGVGHYNTYNHDNVGLFGYGINSDNTKQFKFGYGGLQINHDFSGNLTVFDSIRNTMSFRHDSRTDTTMIMGTAVFGKASTLGSPTSTGYSHIFRSPNNTSTTLLVESGRAQNVNGEANIRLLPSYAWGSGIEFGNSYNGQLNFYSYFKGKRIMRVGYDLNYGLTVLGNLNSRDTSDTRDIFSTINNKVVFYGKYEFADATPDPTAGAIATPTWTAGVPSFKRSQSGVYTGTTDGSGDLTVTFAAAMPDVTYAMQVTAEGTTSYTTSVHTKATGTCKVRFFNPATGVAITATSVTISYEAKDY